MRCRTVKLEGDGVVAIVCGRGAEKAAPLCDSCKARVSTGLCDFPLSISRPFPKGKNKNNVTPQELLALTTCSRPLCPSCTEREGKKDYCGPHIRMVRAQLAEAKA